MIWLAAFCAALGAVLWGGPAPARVMKRLATQPRAKAEDRRLLLAAAALAGIVATGLAGALIGGDRGLAIALCLLIIGLTLRQVLVHHRRERDRRRRRGEVVQACESLAGLVRLGHIPATALAAAARDSPVLSDAAAVHEVGGDVVDSLRALGAAPGGEGLAELANAWAVAGRTGASLTVALDGVSERLVSDRSVRRVVSTELSAPRATGRLLGALPLAGLGLGYAFGGDPIGYLTGSLIGQACLVCGVGLGCLGVLWTERIADSAGG